MRYFFSGIFLRFAQKLVVISIIAAFSQTAAAQNNMSWGGQGRTGADDRPYVPFEEAYKRAYNIRRVSNVDITVDGRLDEPIWQDPEGWSEDFIVSVPDERRVPESKTRAKLFYDDKYLYVGFWCQELEMDKLNRIITNRDHNAAQVVGDVVAIALDTYHDFRAAIEFNINLGGTKTDLVVTDAVDVNASWNAVWEARTHINWEESYWTAEFKVPFSQMRYNYQDTVGIWGMNLRRNVRHSNENHKWSLIPRPNPGFVYSYGELHGMLNLPKPRGIEFLPYASGKLLVDERIPGSPYQTGRTWSGNVGLDSKVALSDFTMDITINPDYGQIEVDPSVMNLTALETFYDEKRPFFLEGDHLLDFRIGSDRMFYTRRIGARALYNPPDIDNISSFAETLENVRILGAVKLTGTNRSGISLGIVQSVTAPTHANVSRRATESERLQKSSVLVEPLTNYTVVRLRKNWGGNTLLGGMFTSVNRNLSKDYLKEVLINNAFTAGVDFTQHFMQRLFYIDMKLMVSSLHGSKEAITLLQERPTHNFQRVSADYREVNDNLTSLTGTSGAFEIGRRGTSRWTYTGSFSWISPGFNLNDVGFLRSTDIYQTRVEVAYRQRGVWRNMRSNSLTFTQENHWDFGNKPIRNHIQANWSTQFQNRWQFSIREQYGWNFVDNRLLRGGPSLQYDPFLYSQISFNTDRGRRVSGELRYVNDQNPGKRRNSHTWTPSVALRLGNHTQMSVEYAYTKNDNSVERVATTRDQNGDTHYIMGYIHQKTHGLTLKMQVNFTPDISLQFYGSPFTSTAYYDELKLATNTMSKTYENRFHIFTDSEISFDEANNRYNVSKDGRDYRFSNPNFSFNEFRSNLVARWEYRPGSTIYLVWEHTMSNRDQNYVSGWADNLDRMFGLPASNIFMVKFNYWFGL